MTEAVFFDTLRHGLWVAVLMSTPILMVALATGIAIGLFQALTSIQEMTLTFVPKIIVMMATIVVFLPFMMTALIEFTHTLFDRAIGLG